MGVDAIIIGSGFGGSVLACRLAEAGRSVLVLERGRDWRVEDYPSQAQDNWIWDSDSPEEDNGWIDLRVFPKMAVAQGAGVGGGSLIYANIFIEAEENAFKSGWPQEISQAVLKPYYAMAGEMLAATPLPENQLTQRAKMVREAAQKAGYQDRLRKLDLAVSFDGNWSYDLADCHNPSHSKRFTNAHGAQQGTCIHCGNCDIGCPVQAKNTLDLNYLARAKAAGAEIRPLHVVSHIAPKDGGYVVHVDRIEDGRREELTLEAKEVYLAAGSLGSTELLLRSRDAFDTLPNIGASLGVGWTANGDFLTPALYGGRDISPTRGPTISTAISFLDGAKGGHEFFVQDGGFPDLFGNAMEHLSRRNAVFGGIVRLIGDLLGRSLRDRDPMQAIMPWFGQAVDASDGVLSLRRKFGIFGDWQLDLDWDPDASEPVMNAFIAMHKELSEATDGTALVPPSWTVMKYLVTPHPLGGCRMADTPADGVTDHKGEVFGYPGLYVVDGAVIPRPVGLNPSRTIAAVAERIAAKRLAA